MNMLQNFHLAVIKYLYRGRRAVPLQTFTTRHSNRTLSIVMVLSTTFTQCASVTTKFGKITQNKGHFAVQVHSLHWFWYQSKAHIRLHVKTIARQVLSIKSWIYESAKIYTVGVARSLCRCLLLDIAIVNCPLSTTFTQCARKLPNSAKITQNKGHFAVQGHSMSTILVPIEIS